MSLVEIQLIVKLALHCEGMQEQQCQMHQPRNVGKVHHEGELKREMPAARTAAVSRWGWDLCPHKMRLACLLHFFTYLNIPLVYINEFPKLCSYSWCALFHQQCFYISSKNRGFLSLKHRALGTVFYCKFGYTKYTTVHTRSRFWMYVLDAANLDKDTKGTNSVPFRAKMQSDTEMCQRLLFLTPGCIFLLQLFASLKE